jgi:predicted pyridoxine 5'-phosphate oxidase superfamily flavin-nucleotide-binding protein/catechol 2,3-dioxygenase-like lactoylglutathione lyase family enzyme
MARNYVHTLFSDAARAMQAADGSREAYARMEAGADGSPDRLTAKEAEFIAERDSFYLATVTPDGWPYVQHRGGPPGFLKLLDGNQLGFADYRGNRQHVTTSSLAVEPRLSLFLVDYPNRRRLKIIGRGAARRADARRLRRDRRARLSDRRRRLRLELPPAYHPALHRGRYRSEHQAVRAGDRAASRRSRTAARRYFQPQRKGAVMTSNTPLTLGAHHIGLAVLDLDAASAFFCEVLGFSVAGEVPAYPARFVSDGVTLITLWQVEDPETATPFDRRRNVGLHHLALKVADAGTLDLVHQRVRDWPGTAIEFAPGPMRAGSPVSHMICTIPGGIRVEFATPFGG